MSIGFLHLLIELFWESITDMIPNSVAPVFRGAPPKGKIQNVPDHPPPQGYVCYRCGEKGHWIMECPTNSDPNFDGRPRIKRTTGIPKSFLKSVEKPTNVVNDGTVDDAKQPMGVMVNSDGEWVVAEPDQAAWDKYQAKKKVSAAAQNAAAQGSQELQDRGLECKIDKRLFVDPTKTPCCHTTYCHECIQNVLLDNGLRCPQCLTDNVPVDDLIPNEEMAANIRRYEEEKTKEKYCTLIEQEHDEKSPMRSKSPSKSPLTKLGASEDIVKEHGVSWRKRPAEFELDNDHKPQGSMNLDYMPRSGDHVPKRVQDNKMKSPKSSRQVTLPDGNYMNSSAFNAMAFPNLNGFISAGFQMTAGPSTSFSTAMPNPMMMMPNPQLMGNDWSNGWSMGYPQQCMSVEGELQNGMMHHGAFNMDNMQRLTANKYLHGTVASGMDPSGQFANQQRSNNEEESAYFRKPVNPYRQQNRRNLHQNRPADYHEI